MPNWCSNRFAIYGDDKASLMKCWMQFKNAISDTPNFTPVQSSWDQDWLGNLFLEAGYTEADINDQQWISCRGSVTGLEFDADHILLDSETAWGPNDEAMQRLLDEKYPGLHLVYVAQESGCEIYINSDTEGRFFKQKVNVDLNCEITGEAGWEDFDSWDDAMNWIKSSLSITDEEVAEIRQAPNNDKKFEEILKRHYPNATEDEIDNSFLYIHEYEVD